MLPPGYLARRLAAGASGSASAGPASTALRSMAARAASFVRCLAVAYIVAQVAIWHSFYAADPWRLAGPVVAAVWAVAVVAYLQRRRPGWQLAGIDSAVYVALGLSAEWCVPPQMHGDAANWLFIAMQSQLVVPAWFAATSVAAPLVIASAAAYSAGAVMTRAAGGNSPAAAAVLLLAIGGGHCWGRRMLHLRAAGADIALAQADRDSREQYVILSRNIERREHERLLHDTVLNTLTALARAGSGDAVIGRCRHDVTLMEYALGGPGDPAKAASRPYGGLLIGIEAVAVEMRARGLDVHVEVSSGFRAGTDVPGEAGAAARGGGGPAVPVPVAAAMAHAVREALTNVASHAGTGKAWVEVSLAAPGGEAAGPGGFRVTVRDEGGGFDPAGVDRARLGLQRSIIERVADWGGQASVRSAPGDGTMVSLCWSASEGRGEEAVAAGGLHRVGLPW